MAYKKTIQLVAAALAAAAFPAAAQMTPWYLGVGLGQSKTDSAIVTNREANINPATDFTSSFDDKDSAWKATLGYRINDLFSLEANYADYGKVTIDTRFTVPGGTPGGVFSERKVKGYGIDVVIGTPFLQRFAVFGRLGYFRSETEATATLSGDTFFADGDPRTSRTNKVHNDSTKYGVGLDWLLTKNASVRLEWERLVDVGRKFEPGTSGATGEADMEMWSLGAIWRF